MSAFYSLLTLSFFVQLLASGSAIASSWCYGNKSIKGPIIGLISQVPWWTIMFMDSLWGLLPVNAMMVITHARNLYKWWNE